jgi:hypothetical protein
MKYFKTRCTKWRNLIKYKKCIHTFQAIGYEGMMQPTQVIFQGQWTVSKYSSPQQYEKKNLERSITATSQARF